MFCDTRLGGEERWFLEEPPGANLRIPDNMKNCVCFLCVERNEDGVTTYGYVGTAFFVRVAAESIGKLAGGGEISFVYLVTARHCVERAAQYGPLKARLNRIDGSSIIVGLPDKWVFHENDASDVAVLRVGAPRSTDSKTPSGPPMEGVDFQVLPPICFATDQVTKQEQIGIGDELFMMGLFTRRHRAKRNIPIVRTGVIASMPEEPLLDAGGREYNAYLAEVRSIGGLSGSPVFVYLPPARQVDTNRVGSIPNAKFLVLGLIRGHWDIQGEGAIDFASDENSKLNMGIALVTPFQDVWEVLMSEEFKKQRKKAESEWHKAQQPTLDSGLDEKPDSDVFTRHDFEAALKKVARKIEPPTDESTP